MDVPTESKLVEEVAESISLGERVDWEQVDGAAVDSHDTNILLGLQMLDRIATFHRTPEPVLTARDPSQTSTGRDQPADLAALDLRTWGHLTIIEKIGEGTFAVLYRARDDKLQSDVALKLLKPRALSAPSRALEEARLLARIRHPNVVKVYGADLIDGRVGVWMELVKGHTLAEILRTQGPLSASEAKIVGLDLCRALAAVHREGLIHGDIKAHNVMREEGGRTVLMDFGTGKDLTTEPQALSRWWMDDFAGTPVYLPPETFDGRKRSETTDIYSLGVLLYHLVSDAYPVEGRSRDEIEHAHRLRERRHLRDVRPDLPEEFIETVERAIEFDPAQRHRSAGAFEAALQRRTPDPAPHSWRTRLAWGAVAVGTALVLGLLYKEMAVGVQPASGVASGPVVRLDRTASAPAPTATDGGYQIEAVFYRDAPRQPRSRLRSGQRVAPGDEIYAEVLTSSATYVYIINEDEQGESNLLFPLVGQSVANPLPAGKTNLLPGPYRWQVDKAGGREHFLVLASPTRLSEFEQTIFASLPRPEINKPVLSARLSDRAKGVLRSVGGLVVRPGSTPQLAGPLVQLFRAEPLRDIRETAHGLWVRELALDNPVK